jgi:phosphoenolpyruvate phosphomutase
MTNSDILRTKLQSDSILKIGGAFDAMSAKLVELNNFDAIWAGSFAISATHGLPDASILTMTEFLNVATNMVDSCKIPIIADCDTGFGGPSNVFHLVKKYEKAGVAAICIEDKTFPKQNSLLENGTQELLPERDFVAKIIAAKNAQKDKDFMIIARTESLIANLGIDEAIKRSLAYEKAGADAILIHSKKETPDEVFEFANSWGGNLPLVIVPTTYPQVSIQELKINKIKMIIYANQTLRIAHLAMSKYLKKLSNAERITDVEDELSSMKDIFHLQKMYELKKQEEMIEANLKKMGYLN